MQRFYFNLSIPAAEYLRYYRGAAHTVIVHTNEGLKLSLPAANLRQFVTPSGIFGHFCVTVDAQRRLVGLERVRPLR
jgi:hypothetical protein